MHPILRLATAGAIVVAVGGAPAAAGAPSIDDAYGTLATRVPRDIGPGACLFYTPTVDNGHRHLYLLVDSRNDLKKAHRLARAAGPERFTTVGLNPGRFHRREMDRIGKALMATVPVPMSAGRPFRPPLRPVSTKHCQPLQVFVQEGTPDYDKLHDWAYAQQQKFGADRVIVTVIATDVPPPD
jgi:hypothetical protein